MYNHYSLYLSILNDYIMIPCGLAEDGYINNDILHTLHDKNMMKMFDDAFTTEPRLPSVYRLLNGEIHVDEFGFKQQMMDQTVAVCYVCRQLRNFYVWHSLEYKNKVSKWSELIYAKTKLKVNKNIRTLVYGGIPNKFRGQVWFSLQAPYIDGLVERYGPNYFASLCRLASQDDNLCGGTIKQIKLDLLRTLPSNVQFESIESDGVVQLYNVLLAYSFHNPTIGYCQGMNFIAGISLLFLSAERTFWLMVSIIENIFGNEYFYESLAGAQIDQMLLGDLFHHFVPKLHNHFARHNIELSVVTFPWFMTIFYDSFPFETILRVWDCFFLDGKEALFRFTLAFFKTNERAILEMPDTISILKHIKYASLSSVSKNLLIDRAYGEEFEDFPSRGDMKSMREHYFRKSQNNLLNLRRIKKSIVEDHGMEQFSAEYSKECCTNVTDHHVWLCSATKDRSTIFEISLSYDTMTELNIEVDISVVCMKAIEQSFVLMGGLCGSIVAVDIHELGIVWDIRCPDSVMNLLVVENVDTDVRTIYAGLANGNLALFDLPACSKGPVGFMTIPVSKWPISCLCYEQAHIFCGAGNSVHTIAVRTLNRIGGFEVSPNSFDYISHMAEDPNGLWIARNGSACLELYDFLSGNILASIDTKTDRYMEREEYYRIMCLLVDRNAKTIFIGNSNGNFLVYSLLQEDLTLTPDSFNDQSDQRRKSIFEEDSLASQLGGPSELKFNLVMNIKNSDHPLRCIMKARSGSVVITSSGLDTPNENVLKWTKTLKTDSWLTDQVVRSKAVARKSKNKTAYSSAVSFIKRASSIINKY